MKSEYYVWWLNQHQCELISESGANEKLPEYLQDQFEDRYGRPGRGRLWIHDDLPNDIEIKNWPDNELGNQLAGKREKSLDAGGIVFCAEDLKQLVEFPGNITDLSLNLIQLAKC